MARADTAQSLDMGNDGDRVRQRRERLGMDKKRLATEAGVSRETLAAIEQGQGFRRSTLAAIEAALDAAELEAGITNTPSAPGDTGLVEFEVDGDRVVVRGPVENADHLAHIVGQLIAGMRADRPVQSDDTDTEG